MTGDAARARVVLTRRSWRRLARELARRGGGERESGAFLLARPGSAGRVRRVVYYDDLDPACLTGGISFSGTGYSKLWRLCAAGGLTVVADVHTHPGDWVGQSGIDSSNPMIARPGHVALIAPRYALGATPEACGVHVYGGDGAWRVPDVDEPALVVRRIVPITGAEAAAAANAAGRRAAALVRRVLRPLGRSSQ